MLQLGYIVVDAQGEYLENCNVTETIMANVARITAAGQDWITCPHSLKSAGQLSSDIGLYTQLKHMYNIYHASMS